MHGFLLVLDLDVQSCKLLRSKESRRGEMGVVLLHLCLPFYLVARDSLSGWWWEVACVVNEKVTKVWFSWRVPLV